MRIKRIIGVGNEIAGDDAVGPAVIEALRPRRLPKNVELVSVGADALAVIEYLQQDCDAIIVDAVHVGKAPGTVLTFPVERAKVTIESDAFSLHGVGLSYVLNLAEQLGLPARVTIVGIEPESVQPGQPMADVVSKAIPEAVDAILNLIHARRRRNPLPQGVLNPDCRAACSAQGAASAPPAHEGEPDGEKSVDH